MGRLQWIAVAAAAVLFVILYWGLDRRPAEMRDVVERRQDQLVATSAQSLLNEAIPLLDARTEAEIHGYSKQLEAATSDERRIEVLKQLSGAWYRAGNGALAGHYAQQIAELAPSDTTWGITATTFALCLRNPENSEKVSTYCREQAVNAYETAISLNPEETSHRVNLAIFYADNPPADNPMKGILQLLDLNKKNPDNVSVLIQLGRLALQTGQDEKAVTRLQRAVSLAPASRSAQCLLLEAARRVGNAELAAKSETACRALSEPN